MPHLPPPGLPTARWSGLTGLLLLFPVLLPAADSVLLTLPGPTITLQPGRAASFTAQVTPVGGFRGTVAVDVLGMPAGVTVFPSSLTVTVGPGPAAPTLTLVASAAAAPVSFPGTSPGLPDSVIFVPMVRATVDGSAVTAPLPLVISLQDPAFLPTIIDLPVLRISTDGGVAIASEEDYVAAALSITPTTGYAAYSGSIQIKGHGSSTWLMPKKPYHLKLGSKASLLGMPSSKDWILLANYADRTLLRNHLAFEISRRLSMAWTPRSVAVEVFVNAAYQGTYQLVEQIKIDKNRVDIASLGTSDTSGTALTGGYLLEVDRHGGDETYIQTSLGVPFAIKDPDPPAAEQLAYISNYLQSAESALFANTFADPASGWQVWLDEGSFVNWYLANELMGNQDSGFNSSCYVYKNRSNPRLYMGPVWDFDISLGNTTADGVRDPATLITRGGTWYNRLFYDPVFLGRVSSRWQQAKSSLIDTLPAFIDQAATTLAQAQRNNFTRWPILGEGVWPNPEAKGTYAAEVAAMKGWLAQRIAYLDTLYGAGVQTAACSHSFAVPPPANLSAAGGKFTVQVNEPNADCKWAATSAALWMRPAQPAASGTATITFTAEPNPGVARKGTLTIAGRLFEVTQAAGAPDSTPPFGSFDTPANGTTNVSGAIAVTGWALDDKGVTKVELYREPLSGENGGLFGWVYIGEALFVAGARPDVATAYAAYPSAQRAGWGYQLLTNMLPAGGNGTFTLHALAYDLSGNVSELTYVPGPPEVRAAGRTIVCNNAGAARPFGTLDTPAQGATVAGSGYVNFGWALTPGSGFTIPADGSTIALILDGVPQPGHPTYNQYRSDIAAQFASYSNSAGAVGYSILDTTKLSDGLHAISWNVTDSAGRSEGLGSRYFTVANNTTTTFSGSSPAAPLSLAEARGSARRRLGVSLRRNSPAARLEPLQPDANGEYLVEVEQLERLELHSGGSGPAYLRVGDQLEPLPAGSQLDAAQGIFYWQTGAPFLGLYTLAFGTGDAAVTVRVNIVPQRFE